MKRMRIELARGKPAAILIAEVMTGLGYSVSPPEPSEIIWVSDASKPDDLPLVTYTDPSDKEVWVVIGRR